MNRGKIIRLLLANLALALLITIIVFKGLSQSPADFFIYVIWAFVISITQWIGHSYIFHKLDKKFSWREHSVKRAIIGSLSIITYAVFAYLVVQVIMYLIVYGKLPEDHLYWVLKSSYIAIIASFAISIVSASVGFLQAWKASVLETERVKAEMLRYKYESLQNQINPHFLFNSFNVLSDLVYEDQKKAVHFIKQMSELFRYVLDSREKELVPVSRELDFISSFAYLLQTRFEDKLIFKIDVTANQDKMLVPMTLQLLIENCVKHNEISASKPLTIKITEDEGCIRVENNLQAKKPGYVSTGTGLSNIIQQYGYFTERQVLIQESDHFFAVEIPLIIANDQ